MFFINQSTPLKSTTKLGLNKNKMELLTKITTTEKLTSQYSNPNTLKNLPPQINYIHNKV